MLYGTHTFLNQLTKEAKEDKKDITIHFGLIVPLCMVQCRTSWYRYRWTTLVVYHIILNRFSKNTLVEFRSDLQFAWEFYNSLATAGEGNRYMMYDLNDNVCDWVEFDDNSSRERVRYKMNTGVQQPSVWGIMDDFTVTTTTHIQARWELASLEDTLSWACMKFKPKKSRVLCWSRKSQSRDSNDSVEGLEKEGNQVLRKKMGRNSTSFTCVLQLPLPLSFVIEMFNVAKCRLEMTFCKAQQKICWMQGFPVQSSWKLFQTTGMTPLAEVSETTSCRIWNRWEEPWTKE